MIDAMALVVLDVQIDVQYSVSELWAKNAEIVVDEEGRLKVWSGCGWPVRTDCVQRSRGHGAYRAS